MANIVENNEWVEGIYPLEKTDPLMGGADGIMNRHAKARATRTGYLKEKQEALEETVKGFEEVSPETLDSIAVAVSYAMMKAGQNSKDLVALRDRLTQRGEVVVYNRAVIEGCVVTKSETATRNLSITEGVVFFGSQLMPVNEQLNCAVVPSNNTDKDLFCYAYVIQEKNSLVMHCTALDQEAPEGALLLYKVNVPSNNTAENDPQSAKVTLTSIRRIEDSYPFFYKAAAYAQIALETPYSDANYEVDLDVVDYVGGGFQQGHIYVAERAKNGFKIYTNGTADAMRVRWRTTRRIM